MARKLDKIIVVDVESTCWDGKTPPDQENEIIEIGVCLLDTRSLERSDKRSILVKPSRSTVSPFCTELTTLTQEMVDKGVSFKAACQTITGELEAKQRLWASYGDYDRRMFERQCRSFDIGFPFGPSHLNVKTLFALWQGMPHEVGMAGALERLDIALEGTHHRGHDDAWNIAAVLRTLLEERKAPTAPSAA